jgi:hypothetical protein
VSRRDQDGQSDYKKSQRKVHITMQVSSIYFALIREENSTNATSMSYLPNEVNCLPLLSLEIKWLELK